MIYLVQIPESYSPEQYNEVKVGLQGNVRLNQKYEVVLTTYLGNEIKHSVLGDSFNKELYEAKKFRDLVCGMLHDSTIIRACCVALGGNTEIYEKYGFDEGTNENAIMDIVVKYFNQISQISYLNEENEQLKTKIISLSL